MKLTEIFFESPAKADDKLCHVFKAISPKEVTTNKRNVESEAITDPEPTGPVSDGPK